jgi:outer membrane immunogenic protein
LNKTDTRVFGPSNFIGDGPIDPNTESASQKLSWLGTVRGRLGFTVLDNKLLAFATGGFAYGRVTDSVQTIGVPNGAGGILVGARSDAIRSGWALGGGLEYKFLGDWSAKAEYLRYDLGSQTLTLDFAAVPGDAGNTFSYKFHDSGNIVRVGLNRRF